MKKKKKNKQTNKNTKIKFKLVQFLIHEPFKIKVVLKQMTQLSKNHGRNNFFDKKYLV